jgi:hypothetical protein
MSGNPRKTRAKRPAIATNPRLTRASPAGVCPACHAGGRRFESRRSRFHLQGPAVPGARAPDILVTRTTVSESRD